LTKNLASLVVFDAIQLMILHSGLLFRATLYVCARVYAKSEAILFRSL